MARGASPLRTGKIVYNSGTSVARAAALWIAGDRECLIGQPMTPASIGAASLTPRSTAQAALATDLNCGVVLADRVRERVPTVFVGEYVEEPFTLGWLKRCS